MKNNDPQVRFRYSSSRPLQYLINRLLSDLALRQICGFTAVLSEATFSRKFASSASRKIMERPWPMVSFYLEGHIVEHISRD